MSGIVRANNAGQSGAVSNIETIDSDDYVDVSIDTAHIGNDQVTGAKLNPSLVLGDIIYADGTDTIARLAKGSEDEVLTMGGSNAPTWAAAGSGLAAASQAEMEAASSNTVAATPGRTQNHPGVAKAYGNVDSDGTLTAGSVNITSAAKDATGDYTWTFATDFSNANYTTQVTHEAQDVNNATISIDSITTGTIGVNIWAANSSDTRVDDGNQITAFGDQ